MVSYCIKPREPKYHWLSLACTWKKLFKRKIAACLIPVKRAVKVKKKSYVFFPSILRENEVT